ncbi:MAG: endonuclease Q family protein, partial [Candidatus Roizmanbacteria bacterium]|nr:endonuclease Q family protein [Candidatus Roizmanbacteria bacterium]
EKLVPAESGLFRLSEKEEKRLDKQVPKACRNNNIRFIPTVEVSTIYKKSGKVRKVHSVVIVPNFEAASYVNAKLSRIGNLNADGRPIIGMDSKELLRIALESHPESLYIPAHIWTPWFSIFGSKSGFNSLEETFDELTPHIHAVETGLSSDPAMNWRLSQLDTCTLISNSDAHSPQKLGREANVIRAPLSYQDIIGAVKTNDKRFIGTIEFFPEEGKYHYDGHRLCNVRFSPQETHAHKGLCPRCGLPLVVGVDSRVDELADRKVGYEPKSHKQVEYIIPLIELIGQAAKVGPTVALRIYESVIEEFGDEFSILRTLPIAELAGRYPDLATHIEGMRAQRVIREPGYDGVYGRIMVDVGDSDEKGQQRLFGKS